MVDDLDALIMILGTFVQHCDGRIIVHARHVVSERLDPPNLQTLILIVGKLLELKDTIDLKLKGTIVQGNRIDDLVLMSKNMFLQLYKPRKPFDIVDSTEGAKLFITNIVDHERDRRIKRETGA